MPRLLEVDRLRVEIRDGSRLVRPIDDVSLALDPGETLGLVGESGCGKTMTGMSLMRLLPPGGSVVAGTVRLSGCDLTALPDRELRALRGQEIAMVFQDPMTSLDPTMTIGRQIARPARTHLGLSAKAAEERARETLAMVGIPRAAERLDDYPFQLSGGMRQRVMIAMALVAEPKLLIADEPTTALDATIQEEILDLLDDLKARLGMGMLLVTHDFGVIAGRADRVMVMYAGRIVEHGDVDALLRSPRHPYTEALLRSIPRLGQDRSERLATIPGLPPDLARSFTGCRFAPRCQYATDICRAEDPALGGGSADHPFACFHPRPVDNAVVVLPRVARKPPSTAPDAPPVRPPLLEVVDAHKAYPVRGGFLSGSRLSVQAVSGVTLSVAAGETFGLVGESGCGKSTLGRLMVGLERPDSGRISFDGTDIAALTGSALRRQRRHFQMVFQDPYASLNPKLRIRATVREPLVVQHVGSRKDWNDVVDRLLRDVGLPEDAGRRYPHEFSGGQRQRIGLARALTVRPQMIVADEPVSALDVSIQSQIINKMHDLQREFSLSLVVISHDLAVVNYLADRVGVMYLGKLVEIGPTDVIYGQPAHPYTAGLLEAVPTPDPDSRNRPRTARIRGELPSAVHPPSGCRFRTRCPRAAERCEAQEPLVREITPGRSVACHFPLVAEEQLPPRREARPTTGPAPGGETPG